MLVVVVVKKSQSLHRPEQALRLSLPELQDSRHMRVVRLFSRHMRVVRLFSPKQRPPFTPGKYSWYSFLRKTMKIFRIVRAPPGIRICYLRKRVKKLNVQFVVYKSIIIIRFKFALQVSAPFLAIISYYI